MSAQGWIGKNLAIALNGEVIAAVRAKSVRYAAQPIDITDGESNGFRRILEVADSFTVEVDVDGVATSANYATLRDHWYGEAFSDVEIRHADGGVEAPEDGAFLAALSCTGEHGDAVSFQARFLFSGAVMSNQVAPVLNATQYGENIRLVWSAATVPDGPVDSYDIYRRLNGGEFEWWDFVAGDVLTYVDEDLFEDGDEVTYYVVAYGQATTVLESNQDTVLWEPFGGIIVEEYQSLGEPWLIGYDSVDFFFLESGTFGSLHGDPLPGVDIIVAMDAHVAPVQNGVFGVAGFFLVLEGDSFTPEADEFTSLTINGVTYLTADCSAAANIDAMQCLQNEPPRPAEPHLAQTATDGNRRAWFWPVQAGLVDGEPYTTTFD